MLTSLIITFAFLAMAQPEPWQFWGPHGRDPDAETVKVKLRDGTMLYGFILAEDERMITLELDEPWNPGVRQSKNRSRIVGGWVPEYSNDRKTRIEKGWERLGFVKVRTADGRELAVERAEVEAADAARELAGVMAETGDDAAVSQQEVQLEEPSVVEEVEDASSPPGFIALWGFQIAVALAAAVVIGIIVKTMVLS